MQYTIAGKDIKFTADTLGAELVSVVYRGRERLWQNENGSWKGHAPILFPVCGMCGVTVDGKKYPVKKHGFARTAEFGPAEKGDDFITFVLRSDERTREVYPYEFSFFVTYRLLPNGVDTVLEFKNEGNADAYFFCGGHDSFKLDGDVGGYKIVFDKPERLVHLHHDGDGKLSGQTHDYGTVTDFILPTDFLQEGRTLIFGDISSRSAELRTLKGDKVAKLTFEDFSNLLLWRPDGAHMICIEPWGNLPDAAGIPDCEFCSKKGVRKVAPGDVCTTVIRAEYF